MTTVRLHEQVPAGIRTVSPGAAELTAFCTLTSEQYAAVISAALARVLGQASAATKTTNETSRLRRHIGYFADERAMSLPVADYSFTAPVMADT